MRSAVRPLVLPGEPEVPGDAAVIPLHRRRMITQTEPRDRSTIPWMVAGCAIVALLLITGWHFRNGVDPARALAAKASRVDLVERIQAELAGSAEAEKSAVLAITDAESVSFAEQSRAAGRAVALDRGELEALLASGGTPAEKELLAGFTRAYAELGKVDEEVLALAVKNTNLKAYDLAFGPAAAAVAAFDEALSRVGGKAPGSVGPAAEARLAVLRVQALLAPHIAEESDARMDQLEAAMAAQEAKVTSALDGLARVPRFKADADLAAAVASYATFRELKVKILALSRENTNVRSLALSLNQKRKALVVCTDALGALRQAILEEPIAGVTYGRPVHPR